MPLTVPSALIPYFSKSTTGPLNLITTVLNASANWLTLRHVHVALFGLETDTIVSHTSGQAQIGTAPDRQVLFVSLLRSFHLWNEMGRKLGLDMQALIAAKRLIYVDGLGGNSFSGSTTPKDDLVGLKLGNLDEIEASIRRLVAESRPASSDRPGTKKTLILDGVDFLLALIPDVNAVRLSQLLFRLSKDVEQVVLVCSADGPLLHHYAASATPMQREHLKFITTMAHTSVTVSQLRSLDTGTAKDVTGVLRISAGGSFEAENDEDLLESEWLYQTRGDGSVRVWARGE